MTPTSGSYSLGPNDATLTVKTGTAGPMARAGHNLTLRVQSWSADLVLSDDAAGGSLTLRADSRSLEVVDGRGGPKPLTDEDRAKIPGIIEERILQGSEITFSSDTVKVAENAVTISGTLTLLGTAGPAEFVVTVDAGRHINARTAIRQTAFGLEPYSAMMGALKVKDELIIEVDGQLELNPDG